MSHLTAPRAGDQAPEAAPPPTVPASPEPPAASERGSTPSDPELRAYIRRNLIKTGVILVLVIVVTGFVGIYFNREAMAACQWVMDEVGLMGLAAILFVSDAFCAPIPSDFVLVVVAKSDISHFWPIVIPVLALWSSFAGAVAWYLGTKVGHTAWATRWLGRLQSGQNHALVAKLGKWGVALGALTPIPYSLTCWTAGMLQLTLREIFWVNLLRMPRFFAYYLAFSYSDEIIRFFM